MAFNEYLKVSGIKKLHPYIQTSNFDERGGGGEHRKELRRLRLAIACVRIMFIPILISFLGPFLLLSLLDFAKAAYLFDLLALLVVFSSRA